MSIEIAVIGAGRIGQIHARNIARHADARVRYVVDVNAEAAARLADACGASVADEKTALSDPAIRGVIIASSTNTHLPLITACAEYGKSIFCEKPLDLDTSRAEQCQAAAADGRVSLFVGFNRRFDPSFRRIREAVAEGRVGQLEMVTVTSRDPAPPPLDYLRYSGGLFRDMMIHDFDMVCWLTGSEPKTVFATGAARVNQDVIDAGDIDTAAVIVEMEDGAYCQISNSRRCAYGYDQRIEVFGAMGMLRAENATETLVESANADGFHTGPALPFFLERYETAYRHETDDFVRALAGQSHRLPGARDGVRALQLADAAERSLREGRSVSVAK